MFTIAGVNSDFDFCQSAIKELFSNKSLAERLQTNHGLQLRYPNQYRNLRSFLSVPRIRVGAPSLRLEEHDQDCHYGWAFSLCRADSLTASNR